MYAKIWNYLRGSVRFQCESIAPERVLNLCAVHEIPFWDVQWQTAERFTLRTTREGARLLEAAAAETDAVLQRLDERGAPLVLRRMRRRYVLWAALAAAVVLLWYGNTFIWEFRVTGNDTVPTEKILRALENNGVTIGTRALSFDQEELRNHVLLELEDISWLSVNVKGCTAHVQVVERKRPPEIVDREKRANVVAARAGLVTKVEALDGQAMVMAGSTVTEGQLLISGVAESKSGGVRFMQGRGRVYARTWYELSVRVPLAAEEKAGVKLNPSIFANGEWVKLYGKTTHPLRFTYALSRGPLQDAAGANAIWNITNVTRSTKPSHYMAATYAKVASQDKEVQAKFYDYFPERRTSAGVEQDIYDYLMGKNIEPEMSDSDYADFMVWHRGLAVPAARDLDDEDVQRGKTLFTQIGCAYCHRPSWTTGEDNFTDPTGFFKDGDSRLPRYPHQTIWPYTDMVQHRLHMKNDIRTGWCRTTPLWGRGLSTLVNGGVDRLHDCRANTVIEAIMWHGDPQSDARKSVEAFRELSKEDRDAIVKFIESI